uniref:Uncharacterized protein n=1 Tax=Anguilla anguilla TaxID=7936 RepID=A0A0E9WJ58_ANGAN
MCLCFYFAINIVPIKNIQVSMCYSATYHSKAFKRNFLCPLKLVQL